jgi:hypothetical protein
MVAACSPRDTSDGETEFRSLPHVQVTADMADCAALVDRHVASAKGWAEADYKVAFEAVGNGVATFLVSHVDDYRGFQEPGGGTSVLVEADCADQRVLRELHFQ